MTQDMQKDENTARKTLRSVELGISDTTHPTTAEGGFYLTDEEGEGGVNNQDGTACQVEYRTERSDCIPGTFHIKHWKVIHKDNGTTQWRLRFETSVQCALGAKTEDGKWKVPGLTIEDCAMMAVLRLADLNNQHPCAENEEALEHFRKGLEALNRRRKERAARGVLNTQED